MFLVSLISIFNVFSLLDASDSIGFDLNDDCASFVGRSEQVCQHFIEGFLPRHSTLILSFHGSACNISETLHISGALCMLLYILHEQLRIYFRTVMTWIHYITFFVKFAPKTALIWGCG